MSEMKKQFSLTARSFKKRLLVCCLMLATASSLGLGATKEDFSTPLAAAKSFLTAMKAGDTNALKNATIGSSYTKEWWVQCMRASLATGRLEAAATARFGREEADKAFGETIRSLSLAQALSALTNVDVKIDGTNATVTPKPEKPGRTGAAPGPQEPLKLQRVASQWKVVLEDAAKMDFSAGLMEATAASVEQCATDIKAGKYNTAEQAQRAMDSGIMTQYSKSQEQSNRRPADKPPTK